MSPDGEITWGGVIERALVRRTRPQAFTDVALQLKASGVQSRLQVAEAVLKPRKGPTTWVDPLVPGYLYSLLEIDAVGTDSLLAAALKWSRFGQPKSNNGTSGQVQEVNSLVVEEAAFQVLTKAVITGDRPKTTAETWGLLKQLSRWMKAIMAANAHNDMLAHVEDDKEAASKQEGLVITICLANLLLAVAQNDRILRKLSKFHILQIDLDNVPVSAHSFADSLDDFVPMLLPISIDLANRLEDFRRSQMGHIVSKNAEELDNKMTHIINGVDLTTTLQVQEEMLFQKSRAGIYIFLESLLNGRPFIDDHLLFHYLNTRHKSDTPNIISSLILACFNILANSARKDSKDSVFLRRAFLINKIPLLLVSLSLNLTLSYPSTTIEYCISEALSRVDPAMFPLSMFDSVNELPNKQLTEVRQDFIFACCLHGLIAESSIETLLGEAPLQTLPAGGRYVKQDLVCQCASDIGRVDALIQEIEKMEGNSGAVCSALVQIMNQLCTNKDTAGLRVVCAALSKKPSSMDVLLLFEKVEKLLSPICELLDSWRYEEDQAEHQNVYEEFGIILLMLLAFFRRYNLNLQDLASSIYQPSASSFVAQLLRRKGASDALGDLTVDQRQHLGDWIRGLYDSDGIGDELLSSCDPQEFYALVPTLFHQSILAVTTGSIGFDVFQGGLEYLLGIMLIPSLIPAVDFLSVFLWRNQDPAMEKTAMIVLRTLNAILRPASGSVPDSTEPLRQSVLDITAKDLSASLRSFRPSNNTKKEVEQLLIALQPHVGFSRNDGASATELESWCSSAPIKLTNGPSQPPSASVASSLQAAVRSVFGSFVHWSIAPESAYLTRQDYSQRLMMLATQLLGANSVLDILLHTSRELQKTADHATMMGHPSAVQSVGNTEIALDVATSLIIAISGSADFEHRLGLIYHKEAPPRLPMRNLSLREALSLRVSTPPKGSPDAMQELEARQELLQRWFTIIMKYFLAPPSPPPIQAEGTIAIPAVTDEAMNVDHMGLSNPFGGDDAMLDLTGDLTFDGQDGDMGMSSALLDDFRMGDDLNMDLDL